MRRLSAALLLPTVILTFFVQAQDAKLAVTLGPNAAAWQVGPYQGKIDAVTIDGDGRPASAIGPNGLVVTSAAPIAKDTEVFVRFRITLPKGQLSGLNTKSLRKTADDVEACVERAFLELAKIAAAYFRLMGKLILRL